MRSSRWQLLAAAVATVVAAGMLLVKGPLPSISVYRAIDANNVGQVRAYINWCPPVFDRYYTPSPHIPLLLAIRTKDRDAVCALLIRQGVGLDAGWPSCELRPDGATPLIAAVACGQSIETIRRLLDAGVDVNHPDANGDTPLHHAAWSDRPELVRLLLDRGADIGCRNCAGETPLDVGRKASAGTRAMLEKHGGKRAEELDGNRSSGGE